MAKYYLSVPRTYDENQWCLSEYYGANGVGKVPPGFRVTSNFNTGESYPDDNVHCVYCLDEMGGIGGGDECLDYCHNCEMVMEGEAAVILTEEEYEYLMELDYEA